MNKYKPTKEELQEKQKMINEFLMENANPKPRNRAEKRKYLKEKKNG